MGTRGSFSGTKAVGMWSWELTWPSAEVKNTWSTPPFPNTSSCSAYLFSTWASLSLPLPGFIVLLLIAWHRRKELLFCL